MQSHWYETVLQEYAGRISEGVKDRRVDRLLLESLFHLMDFYSAMLLFHANRLCCVILCCKGSIVTFLDHLRNIEF